MKAFLDDHFLLDNETARIFYHDYASKMPIIDYHNHLPPAEIASDKRFSNLTEIWLSGDHYKWRAMRTLGVPERYITGDASDAEKFLKWAESVPYTARNPLYHWTHLELQRYFKIHELLEPGSAKRIYDQASARLSTPEYSTQSLLRKMNVEVVCTTDDPVDDLGFHQQVQSADSGFLMLPAFRPDKAILIGREGFNGYVDQLEAVTNRNVESLEDLLAVLADRIRYFHDHGCRLADHGLERLFAASYTDPQVDEIFKKRRNGVFISPEEEEQYQSCVLFELGKQYARHGWVQQFHLGALRNANTRMLRELGPDTGFDSIGDYPQATAMSAFLNRLDNDNALAKTILYNLNPADNEILATMIGNFNDGSVRGKMQFGSGWWFLDQKDGMERQLNALSNMGLLSCFIGMLTDSRSFLSFPRHEYFRRILCNLIGRDVHQGELPNDTKWLGGMVKDICYYNAKHYFEFA